MYELISGTFHNWYLLEAKEIGIAGATAIIGPTGSGKSALLDGIQTVVNGNNRNAMHLNSAAGQKHTRTVREYMLGCTSDIDRGAPQRDSCESFLVLCFRDQETRKYVSMGLLMRADKGDLNEEVLYRFVAKGYRFRMADFIDRKADGLEYVVSAETVVQRIRAKAGKDLILANNAKSYVSEYLSAMRPKSPPDATRFLRSFANALAVREMSDPTHFVRRYVLEASPLKVERVRESIEGWREMEQRLHDLEAEIKMAGDVRTKLTNFGLHEVNQQLADFAESWVEAKRQEVLRERTLRDRDRMAADLEASQILISSHDKTLDELRRHLGQLEKALAASNQASSLDKFNEQAKRATDQLRAGEKVLAGLIESYTSVAALRQIRDHLPMSSWHALEHSLALVTMLGGQGLDIYIHNAGEILRHARSVTNICHHIESLSNQRTALAADVIDLDRKVGDLDSLVRKVGDGPMLSKETLRLMDLLEARGIEAKPLPDLVEIKDESWAFSLEAILGPNREALLIPDNQVDAAFQILFQNRRDLDSCRLFSDQRTMAKARRRQMQANSIADIVETDNEVARAFIEYNTGHFVKAETPADLAADNAIMRDGRTTAGLTMRVFRDRQPILGRTASRRAQDQAMAQLDKMRSELHEKQLLVAKLNIAITLVERLRDVHTVERLEEVLGDLFQADSEIKSAQRSRAALEDPDTRRAREEIEQTEAEIESYKSELAEEREKERRLIRDWSRLQSTLTTATEHIEGLRRAALRSEEDQASEDSQLLISLVNPPLTIKACIKEIESELKELNESDKAGWLAEYRNKVSRVRTEKKTFENARSAANASFSTFVTRHLGGKNPLPDTAKETVKLQWIMARERKLLDHELLPHKIAVDNARKEVENYLKEDLLNKLYENFTRVSSQLRSLNDRLEQFPFVGQRYSFSRSINERLRAIYELVMQVGQNPDSGLFGAMSGQASATDVAVAMTYIEDLISREKDTAEIEDYRNYFEFELTIKNEKGESVAFSAISGKFSGGQRQAPFYVAIATSMVSTYYPQGRAGEAKGMGLVLFDEAFDKLDIPNTRALFRFFKSLGLQIVIAAPESERPTFMEVADTMISVSRRPSSPDVYIDNSEVGARAKAAMFNENPENLGYEGFARQMALLADTGEVPAPAETVAAAE